MRLDQDWRRSSARWVRRAAKDRALQSGCAKDLGSPAATRLHAKRASCCSEDCGGAAPPPWIERAWGFLRGLAPPPPLPAPPPTATIFPFFAARYSARRKAPPGMCMSSTSSNFPRVGDDDDDDIDARAKLGRAAAGKTEADALKGAAEDDKVLPKPTDDPPAPSAPPGAAWPASREAAVPAASERRG